MPPKPVESTPITRQRAVYYDTYANIMALTGLYAGDLGCISDHAYEVRWNGSSWDAVSISCKSGLTSNIPTVGEVPVGSLYNATDTGITYQKQGTVWVAILANNLTKTIVKPADEIVNNSNVLQDDNDFKFAVTGSENVHIHMVLYVVSSATAKFKYAFTIPAGGASITGLDNAVAANLVLCDVVNLETAKTISSSSTNAQRITIDGIYKGIGTPGTVQFGWAQGTATAIDTLVMEGSVMQLWQ